MTNHAVLTVWTLDNHNLDPVERDKLLTEEVGAAGEHAAGLRRTPVEQVTRRRPRLQHSGFRRSGSGQGFVGYVRRDVTDGRRRGVHLHSVEILDVIGSA